MISVGIIANPESGKDIRRLVAPASVFGNDEKVRMVRRALLGMDAAGVERVWIMPDSYGIGHRALDGLRLRLEAHLLEMPVRFTGEDSRLAAALMVERGAACLLTLGGDGTNREVAKACGAGAIWDGARVGELVLARAEPGSVGLSSIGAHLLGGAQPPGHGLYLRLAAGGRPVTAPIAPGLIQTVHVAEHRLLAPGAAVAVGCGRPWVLALDGERELALRAGEVVWLRLNPAGPRVVDPRAAIALAARAGAFG
jgi:hypothetical protein